MEKIYAENEHAVLMKGPWSKDHNHTHTHCFFVWSLLVSHRRLALMENECSLNEYWLFFWLLQISLKRKGGKKKSRQWSWKKKESENISFYISSITYNKKWKEGVLIEQMGRIMLSVSRSTDNNQRPLKRQR